MSRFQRRGFMLIKLAVSLLVASILVTGMGSSVYLASRASNPNLGRSRASALSGEVLSDFQREVSYAVAMRAKLRLATASFLPGTVLEEVIISESHLPAAMSAFTVEFPGTTTFTPAQAACITFAFDSGSGAAARLEYGTDSTASPNTRKVSCLLGFDAALDSLWSQEAAASRRIVVQLRDGRVIAGEPDALSDEHRLWVRREVDAIVVSSGFAWTEVQMVEVNRQSIPVEQFRRQLRAQALPPQAIRVAVDVPVVPSLPRMSSTATNQRVQSVEIVAHVANWDHDSESDGLRVLVIPRDRNGRLTPIDGQIDLKLFGKDIRRSYVLDLQPPMFPELGRWSRLIRTTDFDAQGVVLELPFARLPPELDLQLAPEGLLTARLGVSGQGAFDAADDWVWLRPFSVMRDQLQLTTGRRTHSAEQPPQWPSLPASRVPHRRADQRAR